MLAVKAGAVKDNNATTSLVGPQVSSEGANMADIPSPSSETSVSHPVAGAVTSLGAHNEVFAGRHVPPMTILDAKDGISRRAYANCWLILAMEQHLHLHHGG